jgi:hypothetical protein
VLLLCRAAVLRFIELLEFVELLGLLELLELLGFVGLLGFIGFLGDLSLDTRHLPLATLCFTTTSRISTLTRLQKRCIIYTYINST